MDLPEDPWRYFRKSPGVFLAPLDKLETTRARPEGIVNAEKLMGKAYYERGQRRKPISLRELGGGRYEVVDGNSTVAIARKHGWKAIPALVGSL